MKLGYYLKNELFMASLALIILCNMGSLINLAFQFIMARMLTLEDFGALAFLTNLIFLFGVPALAIQTAISKKTIILNAKSDYEKIKGLIVYSFKKLLYISFIISIFFIILISILYKKLGMDFGLLLLSTFMIFLSLMYPVVIGVLQGMKKFLALGWNTIVVFGVKLIVAILLVFSGFRVYGALIGIIIGMVIAIIGGIWGFRHIHYKKQEITFYNASELIPFGALLIITLMYSIDILFGKFIFSAESFGGYSRISLLGKMILFASLSVGTVMFPLSSEGHLKGNNSRAVIWKSSLLVFLICLSGLFLFYFFPKQIISILFGETYLNYSYLLMPLGLAFSFISAINLLVLYGLSINKFKIKESVCLFLLFLLQFASFVIYGSSLKTFTYSYGITSGIIFISILILSLRWKK
jgi:O-antigen/teichoic acid export membrane protein